MLADVVRDIDVTGPGRATEVLLARSTGGQALLDHIAAGRLTVDTTGRCCKARAVRDDRAPSLRESALSIRRALDAYLRGELHPIGRATTSAQNRTTSKTSPSGPHNARRAGPEESRRIPMMRPEDFYEWHEQPRQGDIVLCGISRTHRRGSPQPVSVGIARCALRRDRRRPGTTDKPLAIAAGIGLAHVLTHDCQLDKEWNQRVRELRAGGTTDGAGRGRSNRRHHA